jgi:hypothetical protein
MRRPALLVALLLLGPLAACGRSGTPGQQGSTAAGGDEIVVSDVGFAHPESVLYDSVADVYLVSNIDGDPAKRDDNGFISRLGTDGKIQQLKWIEGTPADTSFTLSAPKGMAIRGDTLYVADINCVKRFVRTTGKPAGEICIEGATFLNDVATDANGTLYVTDTGLEPDQTAAGTDAVYRFTADGKQLEKVIEGSMLGGPNGIAFRGQDGYVVSLVSGEIYQIGPNANRKLILPGDGKRQLDGIVFTRDGAYLFSSWGAKAVYRVGESGETAKVLDDVESPADIGYDGKRNRVLVPLLQKNEVRIKTLVPPKAAAPTPKPSAAPSGAPAPVKP